MVVEDVTEYTTKIVVMLQLKDGISIDYQQSEKMKVGQDNFDPVLLDVKPVSIGSSNSEYSQHVLSDTELRGAHVL